MSLPTDNGPACTFCGKTLSRNDASGQYECLSCTFQRMEGDDVLDVPASEGTAANSYQDPRQKEYEELIRVRDFQINLQNSAPGLIVTKVLIALNVMIHLYVLSITKNYPPAEMGRMYVDIGANIGLLTFDGQWWRLFSSMFIHGGITHLLFNMYALWVIGSIVERLFGSFGFFCIYFISGVLGGVFSLYNHSYNVPSVGASGAVFGVFGALVSYAYFKKMPKPIASGVLKNAGLMILINGAIGFSIPQIDNSAHIGGCIAGIIAAYFIGQDITKLNENKRKTVSVLASVACVILVFSTWNFVKTENSGDLKKLKLEIKKNTLARIEFIDEFNEAEKLKEKSIDELVVSFKEYLISKETAIEILKRDYSDYFLQEGAKLQMLNKESYMPKFVERYTEKYIEDYLAFWDLYKKYFETSNENYIEQAKHLKKKINALRPEDFQ